MSLMLSEGFDRMPPNDEKLSDLRARKAKARQEAALQELKPT